MPSPILRIVGVVVLSTPVGCVAQGPRVGQSTSVQFGVVSDARQVDLTSSAPAGALIGGTLGVASSSGSTARSVRNGIIGAAAGGAVSAAAEGARQGMQYTVQKLDGATSTIITDQREIQKGDCVAVERVGDTANIRRATASYCETGNQQAVKSVDKIVLAQADGCASAKQELVDATTSEAVDLATRKIELLCNG